MKPSEDGYFLAAVVFTMKPIILQDGHLVLYPLQLDKIGSKRQHKRCFKTTSMRNNRLLQAKFLRSQRILANLPPVGQDKIGVIGPVIRGNQVTQRIRGRYPISAMAVEKKNLPETGLKNALAATTLRTRNNRLM